LAIRLPGVVVRRSAALTTYDAGPMPDPCTILALIDSIISIFYAAESGKPGITGPELSAHQHLTQSSIQSHS